MLRRDVAGILTAFRMDRERRELYVEGAADRDFLVWMAGETGTVRGVVKEIAFVEMPNADGGERARVIRLLGLAGEFRDRLRGLVDADHDRLLKRPAPDGIWFTDRRDMEGYLLRDDILAKVLSLGLAVANDSAGAILRQVRALGRRLGILRLVSEMDELNLPFQATRLRRHVTLTKNVLALDFDAYLQALMQNAKLSLSQRPHLLKRVADVAAAHAETDDLELLHGKDAMCLLDVALSRHDVREGETRRLLACAYESRYLATAPTLAEAIAYLCDASA